MRLWQIAEQFAADAQAAGDEAQLFSLLDAAVRELGFSYFALVHSLSFHASAPHLVKLDNYPAYWSELFVRERLYLDDPMLLTSQMAGRGFGWDEISRFMSLTRRHLKILAAARRQGLGAGFTLPVHIPGEPSGSCSFATHGGAALPFRCLHCSGIIGGFAFECARRLRGLPLTPNAVPRLSPRELDTLRLLARLYSDKQIARMLGVSPETVKIYMKALRLQFGVSNRGQIVTRALRLGIIGFDDAIPPSG